MALTRLSLSGLIFKSSTPAVPEPIAAPTPVREPVVLHASAPPSSVLHALNDINKRLEQVLLDLRTESYADVQLRQVAMDLVAAVDLDPDIALAAIFLNQIAGLYAVRHCVETAVVAVIIAHAMGKPAQEVLTIAAAALTMNVGMVRQTENFQCKDCALSSEERAMVRRHPIESVDMLRDAGITDQEWIDYVLLHHEVDDGSGYPEGRSGEEIPPNAKLIGLADRYCAYVSARNYRRSLLPHLALNKLCQDSDAPLDTALANCFVEYIGQYPPGSLVRMKNGEVGVVSHRRDVHGALEVHALRDASGKPMPAPAIRLTDAEGCGIDEALHEDQAGVRFTMKNIWGERASL
ncbi:MAG: HD domain-containing phosphohydrolase [Pseudomonadota bacterium]